MQLIGMLDSPFVRRVAVSLQLLELPFAHRSLSVFRGFDEFRRINPVVKAPTLVCDDGSVLMESTLILEYAEALAAPRSLMPRSLADRLRALRQIGLALIACEKGVQIMLERSVRPAEHQHTAWLERVQSQLAAALSGIESGLSQQPLACTRETIDQPGISCAVAWQFVQHAVPDRARLAAYPLLQAHSTAAELLEAFRRAPHGEGVVQSG